MAVSTSIKLASWEEFGLNNISMFVVSAYVKAWFSSPASKAPSQDFNFLKQLEEYKTQNDEVPIVSVQKLESSLVSE